MMTRRSRVPPELLLAFAVVALAAGGAAVIIAILELSRVLG